MQNQNLLAPSRQIVAQLQERLDQLVQARRGAAQTVSTGCPELDRGLPQQGLCRGTLVEWLSAGPGGGAGSLALSAAREACRDGGPLVVIDRAGCFYPPTAAQAGVPLERLIVVRPDSAADEVWALDQALRLAGRGQRVVLDRPARAAHAAPPATGGRSGGQSRTVRASGHGPRGSVLGRRAFFRHSAAIHGWTPLTPGTAPPARESRGTDLGLGTR